MDGRSPGGKEEVVGGERKGGGGPVKEGGLVRRKVRGNTGKKTKGLGKSNTFLGGW